MSRLVIAGPSSIFDNSLFLHPVNIRSALTRSFTPNQLEIDLYSAEDKYLMLVDLPAGVNEESLELSIEKNSVSVKVVKKIAPIKGYTPVEQNRRAGIFYGQMTLEKEIDENEVIAEVIDQVLWVSLPLAKKPKSSEVIVNFVRAQDDSKLAYPLSASQETAKIIELQDPLKKDTKTE
jgi:HSP20 family protein